MKNTITEQDIAMSTKTNRRQNLKNVAVTSGKRPCRSSAVPSEHVEHRNFVSAFRKRWPDVLMFSIPNGGQRGKVTAHKLKLEGLTPGVPDLFVPEWQLWIEMKRVSGGSLSDAQRAIIPELERVGYKVMVCYGCDDALWQLENGARHWTEKPK